jgi:hypothetical protein
MEQETLARDSLRQFAETASPVIEHCRDRFTFARYSQDRAQFWEARAGVLLALLERRPTAIEVDFDANEIRESLSDHAS